MSPKPALLVIDMQLVAFDGKVTPPILHGAQLLDSVEKLVSVCRDHQLPVVYVQTRAASGRPYAQDVHGWEIHPRLAPRAADRVVFKRHSSGFDGTDLEAVLKDLGVGQLLVCGIWSEHCVANTSRDAAKLGFEVIVAADGHGTVAESAKAASVVVAEQNRQLQELGITALTVDDLAAHLEGR